MNYKELLEKARETYESEDTPHVVKAWLLANIIYPADESEDEKVRKALIELVKYAKGNCLELLHKPFNVVSMDAMLAWLEKQKPIDEEELKKGALKYVARQFMNWLDAKIPEDEMCLSNAECKVIEDAFLKDDWARISHYMCEKLKRQGEQIELKKVEQGNHPRIVMADFNGGEGFFKLNLDNLNKEQVDAIEMIINNPKQGEQTLLVYECADIPQKDFAPIGGKKLDAGKVIEWLYNHLYTVRDKEHESCHHVESAPFMGEHITQTEFVEKFKQDFDL